MPPPLVSAFQVVKTGGEILASRRQKKYDKGKIFIQKIIISMLIFKLTSDIKINYVQILKI